MKENKKGIEVEFSNIGKKYEGRDQYTLENINLTIKKGNFCVILGPSGCGKSTLLRMIAGLNSITKGNLLFNKKRVNDLAPHERDIAMVFQSYALYPHMNVYNNIAFGLKIAKERADVIDRRVKDVSSILNIKEYLYNKPSALSGGQRQRVAIGRAIVRKPSIFLMDEPLSNLDAKLRESMRAELLQIHNLLESTTIYVTHDQHEAMTMGDQIVVMNDSQIQQVGNGKELYHSPQTLFVAEFIGSPTMNFIDGNIINGEFISKNKELKFKLDKVDKNYSEDEELVLGVRTEDLVYKQKSSVKPDLELRVFHLEVAGKDQNVILTNKYLKWISTMSSSIKIENDKVYPFYINKKNIHLFNKKTKERIN